MSSRLPEYQIDSERDPDNGGAVFVIRDEYGRDIFPRRCFSSPEAAREMIAQLEREDADNYAGGEP